MPEDRRLIAELTTALQRLRKATAERRMLQPGSPDFEQALIVEERLSRRVLTLARQGINERRRVSDSG